MTPSPGGHVDDDRASTIADAAELTPTEARIAVAGESGEVADLRGLDATEREVRAAALAQLLLG